MMAPVDLDWHEREMAKLMQRKERKDTWLDVINEALHHLSPLYYTSQVEQAHKIIETILAGQSPVKSLLFPTFKTEPDEEGR